MGILAHGTSSDVAHVIRKGDKQEYAMKIMKKDDGWNPLLFKQECDLFKMLDHPNILGYQDSYIDQKNFYICTELCKGGELFDKKAQKFSEFEAAEYVRTIISAIKHCHEKNIVHRDLRPENILFRSEAQNEIVIIDFGDAKLIEEDKIYNEFVGTAFYVAPECIRDRTGAELKKSDMWAIGVITYVLLTGRPPFNGHGKNANEEILRKIIKVKFSFPQSTRLSNSAKGVINLMIEKETATRLSAEDALKHDWLKGGA